MNSNQTMMLTSILSPYALSYNPWTKEELNVLKARELKAHIKQLTTAIQTSEAYIIGLRKEVESLKGELEALSSESTEE